MKPPRSATLALCAAALALPPLSSQTIQVNKENRTIAITATDHVIVMADTATAPHRLHRLRPRQRLRLRHGSASRTPSSTPLTKVESPKTPSRATTRTSRLSPTTRTKSSPRR